MKTDVKKPIRDQIYDEIVAPENQRPPTADTVAAKVGRNEQTIYYHIRQLIEEGRLTEDLRPTGK